jgi:hypothetical protein
VRSFRRAATRLNNDAVVDASQGPEVGKSRKSLPHRNRAVNFSSTALHVDHAWATSGDAGPVRAAGGIRVSLAGNKRFYR